MVQLWLSLPESEKRAIRVVPAEPISAQTPPAPAATYWTALSGLRHNTRVLPVWMSMRVSVPQT
jgi:hypothetical protein